ncbi:MAG: SpoIID/LytB domain-containing protein [Acidobacteriota bacterium]
MKRALFLLTLLWLFPGAGPSAGEIPATAGAVLPPVMRIGLTGAQGRVVTLGAQDGLEVVDAETGEPPWRDLYQGEVQVVLLGAQEEAATYKVQVGSFQDRGEARNLAGRLERELGEPVEVHHDSQRRLYRVRVGEFDRRLSASALTDRLRGLGFPDAWIATSQQGESAHATLRLVDADYEEKVVGRIRLLIRPAGHGFVSVNGKRYRGVVEIFVHPAGRLGVVNRVNLEDYLRGVVPEEMGPELYAEIEALKAQTVAARTYAVRNRGQYAEEGYDICETARCQVYGGVDSEHSLTDHAVEASEGQVLTYQGALINALFTSTCGGQTENVENVFPEQKEPYLRSVPCVPEADARQEVVAQVEGSARLEFLDLAPSLARGVALLVVLGVVEGQRLEEEFLRSSLDGKDWTLWRRKLAPILGRSFAGEPEGKSRAVSRGSAARDLVQLLGWEQRVEMLLLDADAAVFLGMQPIQLPEPAVDGGGVELALLLREGIMQLSAADGKHAWDEPIHVAETLGILGRLLERYGNTGLMKVRVEQFENAVLETRESGSLALAPRRFLFAAGSPAPVPVSRMAVTRGEPILVHQDRKGRLDYLEGLRPFRSLSDDRFSTRLDWEIKVSQPELSRRLGRLLSIGDLVDLTVVRRGLSGRVAELDVVGTAGRSRLRGFDIRVALRLHETLFTIQRQKDSSGRITEFIFSGKGWGHGVGLCQIGAYGMAVRGQDYRQILTHYYRGVRLEDLHENAALLDMPETAPVR